MTDAELEAERAAIQADERSLLEATKRLRETPHDQAGHAAHHERLQAHLARIRAFKDALQKRSDT
jgi:hypothetical protein